MDLRKRIASDKQVSASALEENRKRFLSIPPKLVEISRHAHQHPHLFSATSSSSITPIRAVGMGLLTSAPRQNPPSHEAPVSADYFRDVRNHPDVLATILDTARSTASYDPATGGTGPFDDSEKATELHNAFLRFIQELDNYIAYMSLTHAYTSTKNEPTELQHLVELVVSEIGDHSDEMRNKVSALIGSACDFVIGPKQEFISPLDVSFQMVALPAVSEEEVSSHNMNPLAHVWHCLATLSPPAPVEPSISLTATTANPDVIIQSFSSTSATFRLHSSAINAYASYLEGTMIITAEELEETLNSRPASTDPALF
ncbi:hypothetical protein L7F22_033998 [Adiantum nelumboides]|nr:hypothetical protein [Adiantum nelumboides]